MKGRNREYRFTRNQFFSLLCGAMANLLEEIGADEVIEHRVQEKCVNACVKATLADLNAEQDQWIEGKREKMERQEAPSTLYIAEARAARIRRP